MIYSAPYGNWIQTNLGGITVPTDCFYNLYSAEQFYNEAEKHGMQIVQMTPAGVLYRLITT